MSTITSGSLPGASGIRGTSLASSIVEVLRLYEKKKLPVDFVASVLGRSQAEINDELNNLEQRGVIKREGEVVSLSPDVSEEPATGS